MAQACRSRSYERTYSCLVEHAEMGGNCSAGTVKENSRGEDLKFGHPWETQDLI